MLGSLVLTCHAMMSRNDVPLRPYLVLYSFDKLNMVSHIVCIPIQHHTRSQVNSVHFRVVENVDNVEDLADNLVRVHKEIQLRMVHCIDVKYDNRPA